MVTPPLKSGGVKRFALPAAFVLAVAAATGCGYTQKPLLPEGVKTVYVSPFKNAIDLSAEISDKQRFRVYRPGVEVDLTSAVVDRFIFDGNLKIADEKSADAVVQAKLIDYRRDPLRYSESDDIQEYRLSITLDVVVFQQPSHKTLWHDTGLIGDTTFFLSGPRAQSEDEAVAKAVEDLARRVVERTIEIW